LNLELPVASFFPYPMAFTGRVYVGLQGHILRRNIVVGAGAGGGPHVVVIRNTGMGTEYGFNLATPQSFFAFDSGFTGGVRVASPSQNGGFPLALTTGPGGSGFVKIMIQTPLGPPFKDIMRGPSPFDLSRLGVFPSQ
jgi:hypothetical protein